MGVIGAWYYNGDYKGLVIEPTLRFYTEGNAKGVYFQGKGIVGRIKGTVIYKKAETSTYDSSGTLTDFKRYTPYPFFDNNIQNLTTAGAGLSIGYQKNLGKSNRWFLDFNVGIQLVSYFIIKDKTTNSNSIYEKKVTHYTQGNLYTYYDKDSLYNFMNPGSFFTTNFFIGYKF